MFSKSFSNTYLVESPRAIVVLILFASLTVVAFAQQTYPAGASGSMPIKSRLVQRQALATVFESNVGQADLRYKFMARQGRMALGFRDDHIEIRVLGSDALRKLQVVFDGKNDGASIVGEHLLPGTVNYLRGSNPGDFKRSIPTYGRVRYPSLYAGIDLLFYGSAGRLEHDFVVAPGSSPDSIRMRVEGADSLELSAAGDLLIHAGDTRIEFHKPLAYQASPSGRKEVPSAYRLHDDVIALNIGEYDHSQTLIIDPVFDYSTYLADSYLQPAAVATDAGGNTYVTGLVFDPAYPTTVGAYQRTCASCGNTPDIFVTKLSADGTTQVYSTYLGGASYDQPFGLAVDSDGNAIVVGRTESNDFPRKNSADNPPNAYAATHAFVTSLSADGSALNWSSVVGAGTPSNPSVTSIAYAVAVDQSGNAYITGTTNAPAFPVTPGALRATTPGYPHLSVFVTKFLPNGVLGYSAIAGNAEPTNGGGGPVGASAIAVDSSGSAYVYGKAGTLWPITPNAYQATIPGPYPYAAPFVSKVSPDGTKLTYSTYVGDGWSAAAIAINGNGEAILTGSGAETDYPVTPDARVPTHDIYTGASWLTILNATGTGLVYSSLLSSGDSQSYSVAVDSSGRIWLAGTTSDSTFPLIHPLQSTIGIDDFGRESSGFISQYDATGKQLLFSSYFGGAGWGMISDVAVDPADKVHFTGSAPTELFTTPGAFHPSVPPPPPNYYPTFGFAAKIDVAVDSSAVCYPGLDARGINFFYVRVGRPSTQTLTISNCGTSPLVITSVETTNPSFVIPSETNQCQASIPVNGSCTLAVQFTPTAPAVSTAKLRLTSNAPIPSSVLPLYGIGAVPVLSLIFPSVHFNTVLLGQTTQEYLWIENNGDAPLQLDPARITITDDFLFDASYCSEPVWPGQACVVLVTFAPKTVGAHTGTITIASDDPANPLVPAPLSGIAVGVYPKPVITSTTPVALAVSTEPITVHMFGDNFFPGSVVRVAGVVQPSHFSSTSVISVTIDPSLRTVLGQLPITVENPSPGGGEGTPVMLPLYRYLPVTPRALISVPAKNLLYASIPSTAETNPNTVIPIDPATGQLKTPIPVGNNPTTLAASDDGHYLYVAVEGDQAIQRINLVSSKIDRTFAFPQPLNPSLYPPFFVADMHTVPGSPTSVVATINTWYYGSMVALYRDSGLQNAVPVDSWSDVKNFAFVGSDTFYALPFSMRDTFFSTFTVNGSGLHYTPPSGPFNGGNSTTGLTVVSDGKLLYTVSGQVWDPASKAKVGAFSTIGAASDGLTDIIYDPVSDQLFGLGNGTYQGSTTSIVTAVNRGTGAIDGTVPLSFNDWSARDIVRWGSNGLAFIAHLNSPNPQVFLMRSDIVKRSLMPAATLSAESLAFGSIGQGTSSGAKTIILTNSGGAPLAIASLSAIGDFSLTHNCPTNLNAGVSCQVSVVFKPSALGARTGMLTVATDAPTSPEIVSLSGAGVPRITVVSPNGGDVWTVGTTRTISWTSVGLTGNVNITLLRNGLGYQAIAVSVPASQGSYSWTLPNSLAVASDYSVRVMSATDSTIYDASNAKFSVNLPAVYAMVTAPNGGEVWSAATTRTVTWNAVGFTGNVNLTLLKNGIGYKSIATVPASQGTYSWMIPTSVAAGTDYKVRVMSATDSTIYDASNATFAVVLPTKAVTVTAPNGGEVWAMGTMRTITWTSIGITGDVNLTLLKAGIGYKAITTVPVAQGTYSWTLPTNLLLGSDYSIRVMSATDSTVYDASDLKFSVAPQPVGVTVTSPNGGESWKVGSTQSITWISNGMTGNVNVTLLKAGVGYKTIATGVPVSQGTYSWTLPMTLPAASDYTVRIMSATDGTLVDGSNGPFSVAP